MAESLTCSAISRSRNEMLAGSVKPTDIYFLLETNASEYGGWVHEVVKLASKSGPYAPILKHLAQVPRSKVLFIRKPLSNSKKFFVAIANQDKPQLFHYDLNSYDDLFKLDPASVAPDSFPQLDGQAMQTMDTLYTVCTNGKHDNCCSMYGVPFYNALVEQAGEDKVWQVSHIGGHRFAATMICFPQAIVYGQLDPFNAEEVYMNHQAGYMLTYKYRGRSAYGQHGLTVDATRATQTADYHIREAAKLYAIDDLALESCLAQSDTSWQITFVDKKGKSYQTLIEMSQSEPVMTSCESDAEPLPIYTVKDFATV